MDVSLESKSLPSVGNSRKSYLQVTSQRLARGKLVHLHGRRSLALPSVGPGDSKVQTRSARFRRCTKRAAKSLRSNRLTSQRCEVVFQLAVFGFQRDGKLQGEIHSTVQKGCEIISQQKGDFAKLCKILPLAWSDRLAMVVTPSFELRIMHRSAPKVADMTVIKNASWQISLCFPSLHSVFAYGSACVKVMTTLHGSAPSLRRRAKGCVLPEGADLCSQSGFTFLDQSRGEIGSIFRDIKPPVVQDETLHDSLPPPLPPPIPTVPQASPYVLHGHSEVASPTVVQTIVTDDTHACMDPIEQCMRQLRVSDGYVIWDDLEGMLVASLPAKFRMPNIERYMGIGCPPIHLRLYSTVMRAHGLDESQMITLFPLSLSGVAQRWFTFLESSRRRTWDDLAYEFLRQISFNTVVDVSRRELKALRQRSEESISSFISRWHEKIVEIIDKPSVRDHIQMVLRSLQPRIARHVVGVLFTDFGSLVLALYDVEDGISKGLWTYSSPSNVKGKKPFGGQRSVDVSTISSTSQRPLGVISDSTASRDSSFLCTSSVQTTGASSNL
ncbi:hypothetical protein CK203_019634 [Vitis vinifera]|uniref:Retrotransposon gag domain-containing protein n=1 Tax=Vitis vinifera TaxID=29760 RepID=A0A438JQW3_VITVI|nr:hypothetical protein CK203_019634 [Vitis vinifera]